MNVGNVYGNMGSAALSSLGGVSAMGASAQSVAPAAGGAANASISTPGQFFSEMQQLSQSNPTEFKAVAAQVAASFQSAAGQASGTQAQFLTNLANQFTQAAQTGTMPSPSSGQPPQGTSAQGAQAAGGAPHHHHHHGGGVSTQSSVQDAFANAMTILSQATGTTTAATT